MTYILLTPAEMAPRLLASVLHHAASAPQQDDMTAVLIKRLPWQVAKERVAC